MTRVTERWTPPTDPVPSGWAAQQPPPHGVAGPPVAPPSAPPGGWGAPPAWGAAGPGWGPPPVPKPGIIPLRPLGVGEILDGSISALRAQPRLMIGLSALVAVVTQLLTVPITWLLLHDVGDQAFSFDEPTSTEQDVTFAASSMTVAGIQVVVTLIAVLLITGILTIAVSRAVLGEHLPAGTAWERARPRLPALLGFTVLVFLLEVAVIAAAFAPGVIALVADAPTALTVLLFVALPVAGLALAVYLYVAFALGPVVIVLEKSRVVASMRRSRQLVTGAWWRTFGILLLVNLLAQVLASVISVPFALAALVPEMISSGGDSLNPYELLPLVITAVGTIAASAITWPFTAVATALLYVDRRIRREALDIELARAAGVAPPAPRG